MASFPSPGARVVTWLALLAALAFAGGALAQTRYLAFGSSITEGVFFDDCACQCAEQCGYPRRLEERLQAVGMDAVVENHGLGGERTPEGLTRIDSVLAGGGDVLLLMEGTNDIARISRETTLFNLDEMARKAAAAGLSTVHTTLIPRQPDTQRDPDNLLNERMAQGIRDLAASEGRKLVDPFEVLSNILDVFEEFYGNEVPGDVGHLNPAGYDLLADTFFQVLLDLDVIPPVLGPVMPLTEAEEVPPLARVQFSLLDFGAGVDLAATRLFVNGSEVAYTASGSPANYEITYLPTFPNPLPDAVIVSVTSRDLAFPPNLMARDVTNFTTEGIPAEPCVADEVTLCIDHRPGDQRFEVKMSWQTALGGGRSGEAVATPLEPLGFRTGGLMSFVENNPEVLIKVLDGCALNGFFWVFGAATTDLAFQLTIVDTLARMRGAGPGVTNYLVTNLDRNSAPPFFDTQAFDTCAFNE